MYKTAQEVPEGLLEIQLVCDVTTRDFGRPETCEKLNFAFISSILLTELSTFLLLPNRLYA